MILNNQKHRKKPAGFVRLWAALTMPCVALCAAEPTSEALSTNRPGSAGGATNATLQAALRKLNFPGVAINVQERCVDVESSVCLHRGALELVACTKGTKEHESIVAIEARPVHIHAALLLLGAKPGSPATRQRLGDQPERWLDVPPRGGPVDVYESDFRPMKTAFAGGTARSYMKLVVDGLNDRVLGAHMIGADAPEIVQSLAVALTCGATKRDFDRTLAVHPTAAEEFVLMREPVRRHGAEAPAAA